MPLHVATSLDIGTAVRRSLRLHVHLVPDNLLVGPCASSPDAHREARSSYWDFDKRERTHFRASLDEVMKAVSSRSRLVVWTSRLWSDTVALWALCAWRLLHRPLDPKIDIAVVGTASDHAFGRGSIRVTGADVRAGLGSAHPLSLTHAREMARFWRKLTARSPILASTAGRPARGREDLFAIGTYQAGFFPRLIASRPILSRVDELLFSCIEGRWSTPADVFMRSSTAGEALREWASHTGDVFIARRLQAWAEHDGGRAAMEHEPHRPERCMLEARYRLSAAGEKLVQDGLDDIAQAPPLAVGGAVAYDPLASWVVDGERARILDGSR